MLLLRAAQRVGGRGARPRGTPHQVGDEREGAAVKLDGLASVDADEVERAVALTDTALVRAVERVEERADLLSMFERLMESGKLLSRMS